MLILSKSFGLLLIFIQCLLMGGAGYAILKPSSQIACVVESKEAEFSITLEDRSSSKKRKILGRASVELKDGRFLNLKAEKNDNTCVFSLISHGPGLGEIVSIKHGEKVNFLLRPNRELELIKLQMPHSNLKIIAPLSQFILADAANLEARFLAIRAQKIKNRAIINTQELRIKEGTLKNYGQIKNLKGNLSILMNDNALLNMEDGGIYSKSNLSIFDVSTLINEGIIKTREKGVLHIEGVEFYDKGTIQYADKNCMNITIKDVEAEDAEFVSLIEQRERKNSIDSGRWSGSNSGRSRVSSTSSFLSDYEHAEILNWLDNASESDAEEGLEKESNFGSLGQKDLAGGKPLDRFPRRAKPHIYEPQLSSLAAGRPFIKVSPRFNVFRSLIKSGQHKASATKTRTPSLPEARGGSEKKGLSPGFEDKLTTLDSISSLKEGASKNLISKSFETPEEQKTVFSKLDIFFFRALASLGIAERKFSEMFFPKKVVYKFFMILWEFFLIFKYLILLCVVFCLLFFGFRKMLLFFKKDTLGADV